MKLEVSWNAIVFIIFQPHSVIKSTIVYQFSCGYLDNFSFRLNSSNKAFGFNFKIQIQSVQHASGS